MSNHVSIPPQLRTLSGGRDSINIKAPVTAGAPQGIYRLRNLIDGLEVEAPGIKTRLLDQEGNLRRFVSIYVAGEDCRVLADTETSKSKKSEALRIPVNALDVPLHDLEEIAILPSIAGG